MIKRFGLTEVLSFGLLLAVASYLLILPLSLNSSYWVGLFPTFALIGIAFGFAYGPLNIAATNGIEHDEQGLASGIVQTSFQFGGALVLAITTAVNAAYTGHGSGPQATLDGFHTALIVPVAVSIAGLAVTLLGLRSRQAVPGAIGLSSD